MALLPGRCRRCGTRVWWAGMRWREKATPRGRAHRCPEVYAWVEGPGTCHDDDPYGSSRNDAEAS